MIQNGTAKLRNTALFSCRTWNPITRCKSSIPHSLQSSHLLISFMAGPVGNQISWGAPLRKNYDGCFGGYIPYDWNQDKVKLKLEEDTRDRLVAWRTRSCRKRHCHWFCHPKKNPANWFNFKFLVLFSVAAVVLLNADITGRPKGITVWFQILFCFQWILVFCSKY